MPFDVVGLFLEGLSFVLKLLFLFIEQVHLILQLLNPCLEDRGIIGVEGGSVSPACGSVGLRTELALVALAHVMSGHLHVCLSTSVRLLTVRQHLVVQFISALAIEHVRVSCHQVRVVDSGQVLGTERLNSLGG